MFHWQKIGVLCSAWILALSLESGLVAAAPEAINAAKVYKLGLITQREANDPFWKPVEDIMQAACDDLGMTLSRYYAHSDQRNMLAALEQAAQDGVDAVLFPNFKEVAPKMFKLSDELRLPVILFNADVNEKNRQLTGEPRQKFPFWLGRVMPGDEEAGYLLAKTLINRAYQKQLVKAGEPLKIVGVTGTLVETPARVRVDGLKRAVAEHATVQIEQIVHAFWEAELSYSKTKQLLKRYPDTDIVWSASDHMALGVLRAFDELAIIPGKDILTGGIDWTAEGVQQVQAGNFETTVGGHIADAAWITVMLYDYFQGEDFFSSGFEELLPMSRFNKLHAPLYLNRIKSAEWSDLDFRRFSRVLNPELDDYQFDLGILYSK